MDIDRLLIAYVPRIDRCLIDFFWRERLPIFVLPELFFTNLPAFEPDPLALRPFESVSMLRSLGFKVDLLGGDSPHKINRLATYVLPDSELMRQFAERNLFRKTVEFKAVVLPET